MHIEFLVEEPSAEAALRELLPRLLPNVTFRVHPYGGKQALLARLPSRLRGYRAWLPQDWRVVVLLDADDPPACRELKRQVEQMAIQAGLRPKGRGAEHEDFKVLVRLAIEELEAWFFGDPAALRAAYPRVPKTLERRARYRDPDAIRGGTWEALERELQRAGYHKAGLPKIAAARRIAHHMNPDQNRSRSFQVFRDGIRSMAGGEGG